MSVVLKHLRWLRNQIAHAGSDYEVTEKDVADIKRFYNGLLCRNDPLARLYAIIAKKQAARERQQRVRQPSDKQEASGEQKGLSVAAIAAVAAIIVFTLLGFLIWTACKG